MTKEIKITSSNGNSQAHPGRQLFACYVNGVMLRRKDGVGRWFRTEAAARKAGEVA